MDSIVTPDADTNALASDITKEIVHTAAIAAGVLIGLKVVDAGANKVKAIKARRAAKKTQTEN